VAGVGVQPLITSVMYVASADGYIRTRIWRLSNASPPRIPAG